MRNILDDFFLSLFVLPVLSYPLHSFTFTSPSSISTLLFSYAIPFHLTWLPPSQYLLCLQQTGRTQLYLERSDLHVTGFSISTPQQQMHKQDAGVCEIYKNIKGHHQWARSKHNSSRMSMSFWKYPAGFMQGLSSISLLYIMTTFSEYWCIFTNLCCREIISHILQAGQKISFA